MSKQIWLAPILSNNRERLLSRASDVLAAGPTESLLYIAASLPLLEMAAGRLLDGERVRGVWGSLPVHLFRGFARFVLATAIDEETGLPIAPRIAIDQDSFPMNRSLLSQIIKRLTREEKLRAIAPLANRDGCVNTVATLIGEIQRAGKTPAEFNAIIEARVRDSHPPSSSLPDDRAIPLQIDFDREIGLIYSEYAAVLDRFSLTEDDADQLRSLEVLRGETQGRKVSLPWLAGVRLLVLDGFFDFTPVQGEILRLLIPQVPEVIVNLNKDDRNPEIFRPFSPIIDQLNAIAAFDTRVDNECLPTAGDLSPLRERLFNSLPECAPAPLETAETHEPDITLLECANREVEIRAIAKEIKRLLLVEGYLLSDIALVVRELTDYADVITRVFDEESVPCSLRRSIQLVDVPAARAAVKLLELLVEFRRESRGITLSELADVLKSGYFRLSEDELDTLRLSFKQEHEHLLTAAGYRRGPDEANVGQWDVDELENVIAFVGSELRVGRWLSRARQLTAAMPPPPAQDLESEDDESEPDESAIETPAERFVERRSVIRVEPVEVPLPGSERRAKPAREIHPASIAWSALIVERLARLIDGLPREAALGELRTAVMRLLDQFEFGKQVQGSKEPSDRELSDLALDLRGLESLRRAISAAARSIEISQPGSAGIRAFSDVEADSKIKLATLLDETLRCIRAQSLRTIGSDPSGLKVLKATDIRGLRFRAVFIAGLIEGGFPRRASRDWIYPHEERERLRQYGLALEDISPDTLLKEEHYFYQAVCRATERLCLTRPLVLEDGLETVASYYIEELIQAVSPATIKKISIRNDVDGGTLFDSSRRSELATLAVRQEERRRHRAQREGNFPREVISAVVSVARNEGYLSESADRRIGIERERGGIRFSRFDGLIAEPTLIDRLAQHYGGGHDFSASELSLYGKCAFKFFAERVLKLEPRGEAALDVSALDAGSLLHEALRRFFERHRGERLVELDRAVLKREIGDVADAVFNEHERSVPPLNPLVWRIDRETKKVLLEQVLDYELSIEAKTQSKGVHPAYFELAFGMPGGAVDPNSTDQRLKLHRSSADRAETVQLRGQIDRVDVASDGTIVAYDYKLSKGADIDDLEEGRALQLHIYLAALEQLLLPGREIAGAGYYTMKGVQDRRNKGLYRAAFNDYTAVRNQAKSNLSDSEWNRIRAEMESRIWQFVDGIRAGRFEVFPSAPDDSCPHCDYSAVCRYEKFRIRRKAGSEHAEEMKNEK